MRLIKFITEGRSVSIPYDKAIEDIRKRCSNALGFLKKGAVIYRGIGDAGNTPFLFIDPKKHVRISANTTNIYTALIDGTPSWKNYPKRSQSIICATEKYNAESYGGLYTVLPVNGYRIGVCPKDDMWRSFIKTIGVSAYELNNEFEDLSNRMNTGGLHLRFDDITYKKLVGICKAMDSLYTDEYKDYYSWMSRYNGNFLELLVNLFDPVKNNFSVIKTIGSIPKSDRELWTDSECYMVKTAYIENDITIRDDLLKL